MDMNSFKYLTIATLLLAGCAQTPRPVVSAQPERVVQAAPEPKAEPALVLPNITLSNPLLYEMLLTEFASQRGHSELALDGSADIAQKTRDPRLAKRAAQLALQSGDMNRAIAALGLWRETEPGAAMPPRLLASLLLRGGRLDEASVELARVFKADPAHAGEIFLQIHPLLAAYPDGIAALGLARELASGYPNLAEAHWMVAQLAQKAGDEQLALDEVREAHSQKPDWDFPVMLEASLLVKRDPKQGLELLRRYLFSHPQAKGVRVQYARWLLEQQQYKEAREEFQLLSNENPNSVELAFAVALISLQIKDLPGAEAQLRQALVQGGKGPDSVEYYLGQLNESGENETGAIAHYRGVKGGEYLYAAQLRVVYLLNKQGKLEEAIQYVRKMQASTDQQRAQLVLTEAQLLRDAQKFSQAYEVLRHGLEKLPAHPELFYEAAMMADKIGKYPASEKLLRKLIKMKPDYAHAYNALGYSLLERKVRLKEALALVEKALQLAPQDPAIMDSVGWGYYRNGKLDDAIAMLRRAFTANPDPEIAAHLGEVLWARGDKDEALKLWQDSLKAHPDNAPLQAVMKRFVP